MADVAAMGAPGPPGPPPGPPGPPGPPVTTIMVSMVHGMKFAEPMDALEVEMKGLEKEEMKEKDKEGTLIEEEERLEDEMLIMLDVKEDNVEVKEEELQNDEYSVEGDFNEEDNVEIKEEGELKDKDNAEMKEEGELVEMAEVWLEEERRGNQGPEKVRMRCTEAGCSKEYTHASDIKRHIVSFHRGAKPNLCECGKSFSFRFNLNQHIRTVHRLEKPHKCDEDGCDAKFGTKEQLKIHMRSKHDGGRYPCLEPSCRLEFIQISGLGRHVKTVHRNELPHTCPEAGCYKKFGRLYNLQKHTSMVHRRERLHRCGECGQEFSTGHQVKDHGRHQHGHTKLLCKGGVCSREFVWTSHMYKHMRSHTMKNEPL